MTEKYRRVLKADDTGELFYFPHTDENGKPIEPKLVQLDIFVMPVDYLGNSSLDQKRKYTIHVTETFAKARSLHPKDRSRKPETEINDLLIDCLRELGVLFED